MVRVGQDAPRCLRAAAESVEDGAPSFGISLRGGWEAPTSLRPAIQRARSAVVSVDAAFRSLWLAKENGWDPIMSFSIVIDRESDGAIRFVIAIGSV